MDRGIGGETHRVGTKYEERNDTEGMGYLTDEGFSGRTPATHHSPM